jgi:2-polyprenyl-3-methyl-5-hydroxy-6-metoxy-1,4-benzoquinol methylase
VQKVWSGIGGEKENVEVMDCIMQKEWDYFWNERETKQLAKPSWSKIRIMNILNKYVIKDMTILDAGCGSGFFSNYFISKGCRVYSLDYSERALEIAKNMTNNKAVEYLKRDLLDDSLCFEFKSTFDLIFTDGLFEHFSKNEQNLILNNFTLMKKKDGIIVTFLPNKYSFWTIIRPFFMPGIKEVPFLLEELIFFMKSGGQKIIENGGINVLPIKYSPEFLGNRVGMLVYSISK